MDEPLDCWIAVLLVFFWRGLASRRCATTCLERLARGFCCRHKDDHTPLFEWYVLAVVLFSFGFFFALRDFIIYDYIKMGFLSPALYSLPDPPLHTAEDRRPFMIPDWLRRFALAAPIAGLLALLIMVRHVIWFTRTRKVEKVLEREKKLAGLAQFKVGALVEEREKSQRRGRIKLHDHLGHLYHVAFEDGSDAWFRKSELQFCMRPQNPWRLDEVEDMTMLVIVTPGVFIVMALWAEIRALQVMTASSMGTDNWEGFVLWRTATYVEDLGCAATFQYLSVLAFARLCLQFLSLEPLPQEVETEEERLHLTIDRLGEQLKATMGDAAEDLEHAFPVRTSEKESLLRPLLDSANREYTYSMSTAGLMGVWCYIVLGVTKSTALIASMGLRLLGLQHAQTVIQQYLAKCELAHVTATALCVINMAVILRLERVKDPRALGANANLKFLAARALLLVGDGQKSALHTASVVSKGRFSIHQADLLHVCLLSFECLAIVTWNLFAWSKRADVMNASKKQFKVKHDHELDENVHEILRRGATAIATRKGTSSFGAASSSPAPDRPQASASCPAASPGHCTNETSASPKKAASVPTVSVGESGRSCNCSVQ
eukprot:TRINITY_DN80271_c0_g1_i1.p1 TRINITY_DN80271_c0_g1~~TRINITY_DN80271_c0_g1_i1.p1  ORF type:complete len:604 (-),score=134.47 TRINITY_DN80271_c0_g1_i1:107-1918(-)